MSERNAPYRETLPEDSGQNYEQLMIRRPEVNEGPIPRAKPNFFWYCDLTSLLKLHLRDLLASNLEKRLKVLVFFDQRVQIQHESLYYPLQLLHLDHLTYPSTTPKK